MIKWTLGATSRSRVMIPPSRVDGIIFSRGRVSGISGLGFLICHPATTRHRPGASAMDRTSSNMPVFFTRFHFLRMRRS